jgi:hypothetical protein
MITIPVEYDDGKITIRGEMPKVRARGRLILDDVTDGKPVVDPRQFNFLKAQETLKAYTGNLSDAIIEERRSGH